MTQHTEEGCDRYIKSFKKVRVLFGKMKLVEITRTLEMSERLVPEYVRLIEGQEHKKEVVNHVS